LFSLLLHASAPAEDTLITELWECGTAGILEEDGYIRAFFDSEIPRAALIERFARFHPEIRDEAPVDWAQTSRDAWPPLLIGQRFYLVAPWCDEATPRGRLRLEINPGMACGTGRHPATQLCLEAIERYVRPGDSVLDIGTGSGILARAAALIGAGSVMACDIDPSAVAIAAQDLGVRWFVGSAETVRSECADVVVANIDAATIERIAPELARVRKPGGKLILSGFPEWDIPDGFDAREVLRREEWVCLLS
jgi:ribosomal protein L11 methyltransferase